MEIMKIQKYNLTTRMTMSFKQNLEEDAIVKSLRPTI